MEFAHLHVNWDISEYLFDLPCKQISQNISVFCGIYIFIYTSFSGSTGLTLFAFAYVYPSTLVS